MRLSSPWVRTLLLASTSWWLVKDAAGFVAPGVSQKQDIHRGNLGGNPHSAIRLFLRTGLQVPLLDVLDQDNPENNDGDSEVRMPLPSAHLPSEVATPFLYGMHVVTPIHKLMLEEATSAVAAGRSSFGADEPPIYGHLVWKDPNSDSLVGAIGCTGEILVNAPATEVMDLSVPKESDGQAPTPFSEEPSAEALASTLLCRGGFRFVVKEVVKSIPYPIAIIDEIEDDAEEDDSDFFFSEQEEDDDEDMAKYQQMEGSELIQKTMFGIQAILSQKLEEAIAKQTSPLEKQILEASGVTVDPNAVEQAQAEEKVAVWEVFQACLVDEISPQDRKYAIGLMAAELTEMGNEIRQKILITRDNLERLRIVLKELDEVVGMARARKMATQITDQMDSDHQDLKVGSPQLPPWARTIVKGMRVEYFWNEEHGWCPGKVIEDPKTIVDEILLTIQFDEDGEVHTLPLSADEKVRWRPPEN